MVCITCAEDRENAYLCTCPEGTYDNYVDAECQTCDETCYTCKNDATTCIECAGDLVGAPDCREPYA